MCVCLCVCVGMWVCDLVALYDFKEERGEKCSD